MGCRGSSLTPVNLEYKVKKEVSILTNGSLRLSFKKEF
jgi:hypothetical protein